MQPLVSLVFHNLPSREMTCTLVSPTFWLFCSYNHLGGQAPRKNSGRYTVGSKMRETLRAWLLSRQNGCGAIENGVIHCCVMQTGEILSLETCNARIMIAWVRCTPLTIVDLFGMKIRDFTGSTRVLGR